MVTREMPANEKNELDHLKCMLTLLTACVKCSLIYLPHSAYKTQLLFGSKQIM